MLNFLYMFPIPIIATGGGGKALKGIGGTLEKIVSGFIFSAYFLIFIVVATLLFFGIRFYKFYFVGKLKKILMLLYRLDTELLLFKYIGKVEAKKKLEIDLSREESVELIKNSISKRFFIKRVGNHNYERILDGLEMIEQDKIDVDVQVALVNNWIRIVKSLVTRLK